MTNAPLHRFEEFGQLTAREREAVLGLRTAPRRVRKGCVIQAEGVRVKGFFVLTHGWAAAALVVRNGGRQITKIHLPGDALGTPSMAMHRTTEELIALTDVEVAEVPLSAFGRLFDEHPRVVARFMLSIQQERVALMDRLASIGRTSSEAQLAAFLLDLLERLRPLGVVEGDGFDLLATQEQIGDLLALTAVHINRVFRSLARNGLIERSGKHIRICDVVALQKLAMRPQREPFPNQLWLPSSR